MKRLHIILVVIVAVCVILFLTPYTLHSIKKNFHYTNEAYGFSVDYRAPLIGMFYPFSRKEGLKKGLIERFNFPYFDIEVREEDLYEDPFPSGRVIIGGGCARKAELERYTLYFCQGSGLVDAVENVIVKAR